MFIQRLHEAEAALKKAEQEKEALLAENAMLKVEVANLKQAAAQAEDESVRGGRQAQTHQSIRGGGCAEAEDEPLRGGGERVGGCC